MVLYSRTRQSKKLAKTFETFCLLVFQISPLLTFSWVFHNCLQTMIEAATFVPALIYNEAGVSEKEWERVREKERESARK